MFDKYNVKKKIAFLRNPVDWFMSFYSHAKYHGIHRNIVDFGFDYFVKKSTCIYDDYICSITDSNTVFYDLELMDVKMKVLGYDLSNRSNALPRKNIISQYNYDIITDYYKDSFTIKYKKKAEIGKVEHEVIHLNINNTKRLKSKKNYGRIKRWT